MTSAPKYDVRNELSPNCVTARYTKQRLPQFEGNPLIEALPATFSDEELVQWLQVLPKFSPDQREWPTAERIQMLRSLQAFMVPLSMHFELARALDAMLRSGYVGRVPRTPEHAARMQAIYDKQKEGVPFRQSEASRAAQISGLLIGLSGMGKTTTVREWFAHIPPVIYHPELNLYQVTYLHIEMPSDGSSVKGLAHAILHQLDRLIPGANYYQTYALRGRPGADSLMRSVARLMHIHCVGMLVGDEVQNLANSRKKEDVVMTELVSACNDLGVPILFIGTNKARQVFTQDFRLARRASGNGLAPWKNFTRDVGQGETSEWDDFIRTLWAFQWTQNAVPLDPGLEETIYDCSQGVIDIAIKLFASAQARAMLDGSETLTPELLRDVYKKELVLLHPMVGALRDDDLECLMKYDDIAPIELSDLLEDMQSRVKGLASKAYSVKPGDPTFVPRIVASLVSSGFGEEESEQAALAVTAERSVRNLLQGTAAAIERLSKPKKVSKPRAAPSSREPVAPVPLEVHNSGDYRQAINMARESGTTVYGQLQALGMARPLEAVIPLD